MTPKRKEPSFTDMEQQDFAALYSLKRDEELLALAADECSLTAEARAVLTSELARRKLTPLQSRREVTPSSKRKRSDTINMDENPAFNTPAKISYILLFVFCWGTFVELLTVLIREDNHWKQEIGSIIVGMVVVFGPILAVIIWATHRYFRNKQRVKN
ncbi:MAG TPA: hypothetical protein VFI95_09605 [Terriglobales bacterium]|nr:hypothetical protein [Terriglobales bacterium]